MTLTLKTFIWLDQLVSCFVGVCATEQLQQLPDEAVGRGVGGDVHLSGQQHGADHRRVGGGRHHQQRGSSRGRLRQGHRSILQPRWVELKGSA